MANTYTQIHLHIVIVVKNRSSLINKKWKNELYKYMAGIIRKNNHKLLQINGMPDHVHILIGMRPTQSLSKLMQTLKQNSSKWINEKGFTKGRFAWQSGYGAFSVTKSSLSNVIRYIQNQEEHHKYNSFRKEYLALLIESGIDYDERYIFKEI